MHCRDLLPTAVPNAADLGATRNEIARILMTGLRDGDIPALDRIYVAQLVAVRAAMLDRQKWPRDRSETKVPL